MIQMRQPSQIPLDVTTPAPGEDTERAAPEPESATAHIGHVADSGLWRRLVAWVARLFGRATD